MRNAVRIGDHDRLERRVVEVDAQPIRRFAIETRVAAVAFSSDGDRFKRPQGFTARAAFAVLAHVRLTESRATSFDERRLAISWRMRQRTFKGTCALCGASVDKRRSAAHHSTCAAAHEVGRLARTDLVTLRITAVGAPEYWLDAEADAGAALSKLDTFLRDTWVECCGHLSMFSVPPLRYSSSPSGMSGLLGRANTERSLRAKIGEVFSVHRREGNLRLRFRIDDPADD